MLGGNNANSAARRRHQRGRRRASTKAGTGTFTLASVNTSVAPHDWRPGAVQLANPLALQNSTAQINVNNGLGLNGLTAAVGAISGGATSPRIPGRRSPVGSNNASTTFGGGHQRAGRLVKAGTGTLSLRGDNTYGGGTTVLGGMLDIESDARLGAAGTARHPNNGAVRWTAAALATARPVAVSAGTGTVQTDAHDHVNASVSGAGTLVKSGNGTLVLNASTPSRGSTSPPAGSTCPCPARPARARWPPPISPPAPRSSSSKSLRCRDDRTGQPGATGPWAATSVTFRADAGNTLELDGPLRASPDFQQARGASGAGVGAGTLVSPVTLGYAAPSRATGTLAVRSNTALGRPAAARRVRAGGDTRISRPRSTRAARARRLGRQPGRERWEQHLRRRRGAGGRGDRGRGAGQYLVGGRRLRQLRPDQTGAGRLTTPALNDAATTIGAGTWPCCCRHPQLVGSLSLAAGATLDVGTASLLTGTPAATIRGYLLNAYTLGGDWSGPGLTSSAAAANPAQLAVAYADGNNPANPRGDVPAGKVLVRAAQIGDMNLDGMVDFGDILQMLGAGQYNSGAPAQWTDGDLNYDGVADFGDILACSAAANYNNGVTFAAGSAPFTDGSRAVDLAVPEPSAAALLCLTRHRPPGAPSARTIGET